MLHTEERNPNSTHIDKMNTAEMVRLIHQEDKHALKAVEAVLPQVVRAVDAIADGMRRGGRLIYVGAGTSGRLGVIDAAECPPTYGVSPDVVQALIAGGLKTMSRAAENEEDNREKGAEELCALHPTANDVVCGLSASGGAAYVLGALEAAKAAGCVTVCVCANPGSPLDLAADIPISPDTGAEVITGSTRMKAGTAQKLILNMLSTCAMVQTGKVYENLMINLRPVNIKLTQRMISIVTELTDYDETEAEAALQAHNWSIRETVDAARGDKR